MDQGSLFARANRVLNRAVAPLALSPRWSRFFGGSLTIVTYTGRRSGKAFSMPVAYRRKGDEVEIGVALPDRKQWWRNFSGDGGPISLHLKGVDRTGHAVSTRDPKGGVTVTVTLDPEPAAASPS